jgi:hypothetical protein
MTASRTDKTVVINIGHTVVRDTEKAVCLVVNNQNMWFPRQGVKINLERGQAQVPYWIARKNGILENAVVPSAPEKPAYKPQQPIQPVAHKAAPALGNLQVLEELAKLTAEARAIGHRLAEIQRLITQQQSGSVNHGKY